MNEKLKFQVFWLQFLLASALLVLVIRIPDRLEIGESILVPVGGWFLGASIFFACYNYCNPPWFMQMSKLHSVTYPMVLELSVSIWMLVLASILKLDVFFTVPCAIKAWMEGNMLYILQVVTRDINTARHLCGTFLALGWSCVGLAGAYYSGKANENSGGFGEGVAIWCAIYLGMSIVPAMIILSLLK